MKLFPDHKIEITWPLGSTPATAVRPRVDAALAQLGADNGLTFAWKDPNTLTMTGSGLATGLDGTGRIIGGKIVLVLTIPIQLQPFEAAIKQGIEEALQRELPRKP